MAFRNLGSEGELFPQSVFIIASYGEDGTPNAMNAAWAGECSRKEICFNIGDHKTTANIVARGAFTVAPADAAHVVEADYFGIVSGLHETKVDKAGFHAFPGSHVDAPLFEEFPLMLECLLHDMQETDTGEIRIVGEVVNMSADESILDNDGRIDLGRLEPIMFDSAALAYRVVGEKVGDAFQEGKKLK